MSIDLLALRYKVTNPYPEMERHNIKVGDIITRSENPMYADKTEDGNPIVDIDHEIFPAIFKKIEWYEDREEKDMPEYLKSKIGDLHGNFKYTYHKIIKWDMELMIGYITHINVCNLRLWKPEYNYYPATKEEFESYQSTINKPVK